MMHRLVYRKHLGNVGLDNANKQILLNILSEKPIDVKRLKDFTVHTTLPADYRTIVWKLLTGITARFDELQEFVQNQHILQFEELFKTLKSMRLAAPIAHHNNNMNGHHHLGRRPSLRLRRNGWNGHHSDVKYPEPEHLFLMWLISDGRLLRNPEQQLNDPNNQKYLLIGQKLHYDYDNHVDMYHICSSVWNILRNNEVIIKNCVSSAVHCMKEEYGALHQHLSRIGLFDHSLLEEHGLNLFCELFPESSIEKILDKIIAGSFEILTYLIVTLLCQLQSKLYLSTSMESVRNIFYELRKEEAEMVLLTTLDVWYKRASVPGLTVKFYDI